MSSCSTSEKPASSGCGCGHTAAFDGASPAYKRALAAVIVLNVIGFVVVAVGSWLAASASLAANTLDFAADAATYGLSLWVIGKSVQVRSGAAFLKDLEPVVAMGPDALIMSDPGLIMLVRKNFPHVPIHLSVLANTVNWASVEF